MLQPTTNFEFVVKPKLNLIHLEIQKQTTNYLTIALVLIILLDVYLFIFDIKQSCHKLESQKLSQLNEYIQDHFIDDMILSQKNIQHTI